MTTDTQNPNESSAMQGESGSEEAAILALSDSGQPAEAENNTQTSSDPDDKDTEGTVESQDADEADPDDADGEEAKPTDELVEVDYEGETVKVPAKVKDALLRQSDYSRNMNSLAEEKKAVSADKERAQTILGSVDKLAEAKAQAVVASADVEFYKKTDWAELNATNPRAYAMTWQAFQDAQANLNQALIKAQNVEGELSQAQQDQHVEARDAMVKALSKDLKGWSDELGAKITKYALSQGYTQKDLERITNPKEVIALDKARRFDELQNAKAGLKAKAQDAPILAKPGTTQRLSGKAAIEARFKSKPSEEDAIRLLN
jgi:hypothetical protein